MWHIRPKSANFFKFANVMLQRDITVTKTKMEIPKPERRYLNYGWYDSDNYKSIDIHAWDDIYPPFHDDVIKWKHFRRYWPFVRGIHRSPVNSSHKGLWRGALMFSLICARTNGWVNNRDASDLRLQSNHYDVTVMSKFRAVVRWLLVPLWLSMV